MSATRSPRTAHTSAPPGARPPGAPAKGQQTKAAIIDAALGWPRTLGSKACPLGAGRSYRHEQVGRFAHFGCAKSCKFPWCANTTSALSKEVFYPALDEPRGLPRLRAMFAYWMKRTGGNRPGCIYISGAIEFDEQPGPGATPLADFGARMAGRHAPRHHQQCQEMGQLHAQADP